MTVKRKGTHRRSRATVGKSGKVHRDLQGRAARSRVKATFGGQTVSAKLRRVTTVSAEQ